MPTIISDNQENKLNDFFQQTQVITTVFFIILLIFSFVFAGILTQNAVFADKDYQLPYPGILPNHPLYLLKAGRDRVWDFFTRDPLKKSQLYLLFADKRIGMAEALSNQNWELSEQTASKAEKYLLRVQGSLENSKKIGLSPEVGSISRMIASTKKHREILKKLLKKAPQKQRSGFQQSLKINSDFLRYLENSDLNK